MSDDDFTRCRGMKFRDDDDAYDYFVQRQLDEEAAPQGPERSAEVCGVEQAAAQGQAPAVAAPEAKRAAAGISPELLSLQDARAEGARAGAKGLGPNLNPFQDFTPEHAAWERGRLAALGLSVPKRCIA